MSKRNKTPEDDAAIWARVAGTATPLKKRAGVIREAGPRGPDRSARTAGPGKAKTAEPSQPPARPKRTPQTGLDRQTARRLDKRQLAIQARLDLHGMRQSEAHGALRKFVTWARGKDFRNVLIITGKGSDTEASNFYAGETRGVLRQAVPHWLSEGNLAAHVVSFSPAPRSLGGEGALYVRLRRARSQTAKR